MPADQNLDFALDSPSKRVSVITQTPKKNRIEVANSNTPPVMTSNMGKVMSMASMYYLLYLLTRPPLLFMTSNMAKVTTSSL